MPKDADFKAREFREAVRNILQGYRKEYLAIGDALVESVLQKFNDGIPMTRAVDDAIREVGFFGANAQAVSQMLFLAACAGYGILPKFVAAPSEADIKRKLTETAWTGDGMKLSKRLHALPVRNNIISALGIALRQVKSIKDIAMDIYDGYNSGKGILSKATLRKDMAKLLRTAEAALGDNALMRDLRRQAVTLQSLPHGIQSPRLQAVYNELVKACTADELKAAAIKRAAWAAVEEKTRCHAERIARTEAARAWFDGYIAARENDEDIWGYRWQLSSRHHLCPFDQCDVCANMDVGYGKGIYPKHKVPSIPRHPHCMCMLEDVFSWERKGKRIKPEGARRYIDSLDDQKKRALFGDAGLEAYEKGGDWQKLLRGWDGFLKPKSRLSAGDFKLRNGTAKDIMNGRIAEGALNDKNDPHAKRREAHAEKFYAYMRNSDMHWNIKKLSATTGMSSVSIQKVYKHVFFETHRFRSGEKRFSASYDMAQSFQRLLDGKNIQVHDHILLKHERLEAYLMQRYHYVYEDAHELAERKYNYAKALRDWKRERGDL